TRVPHSARPRLPGAPAGAPASGAVGGRHDQPDVAAGQHEDGGGPVPAGAVDRDEVGVDDREELLVAAVHVVGHAAPVALLRQRQHALYAVAVRFDDDLFFTVLHGGGI